MDSNFLKRFFSLFDWPGKSKNIGQDQDILQTEHFKPSLPMIKGQHAIADLWQKCPRKIIYQMRVTIICMSGRHCSKSAFGGLLATMIVDCYHDPSFPFFPLGKYWATSISRMPLVSLDWSHLLPFPKHFDICSQKSPTYLNKFYCLNVLLGLYFEYFLKYIEICNEEKQVTFCKYIPNSDLYLGTL